MAKQKKKRKANPNSRPRPVKAITQSGEPALYPVRLSQCMIVKNEEKNIEKALSWAKDVAFEQIVVDTGSTDRTVEIAESMGATVYHFEWINDFAAAKNFAIDKARGDWIAFLDADEYLSEEDTRKLMVSLGQVQHPSIRDKCDVLRFTWVHLDDNNQPFAVHEQDRLFRNRPDIRYQGAIHESLTVMDGTIYRIAEINIMHTGYAKSVYADTQKAKRNIELLRVELEKRPDDIELMSYLADSLRIGATEEEHVEVARLYRTVISSRQQINPTIKQMAYNYLIGRNIEDAAQTIPVCAQAVAEFPESIDFLFYYGLLMFNTGRYPEAWEYFTRCEKQLDRRGIDMSNFVLTNPSLLFFEMVKTADALGDKPNAIRCATHLLKEDKYQKGILIPYITLLKAPDSGATDADVLSLLGQLYDLTSPKDKIFLMRAAKDAGELGLTRDIYNLLTPEELEWLSGGDEGEDA